MIDRNRRNHRNFSRRIISLELLEERALLTASGWGGFDPNPDVSVYSVESSEIKIDLSQNSDLDLAAESDFNQDGKNDLIVADSSDSAPVLTLFWGNGDGSYTTGMKTELGLIAGYGTAGILADMTGDGIIDYLTVSQSGLDNSRLNLNLYQYQNDGTFQMTKSSSISLSVFGKYSVYTVTSIRLAEAGGNLAVQLENSFGFDSSGNFHSIDGTAVCTNNGSGTFSNPKLAASVTGELTGSVELDGTHYFVSLNKNTRCIAFWSYSSAQTTWTNSGNISYTSVAGNIGIVSVTSTGNRLWFSGNIGGSTMIYDLFITADNTKVVLASSQGYTLQRSRSVSSILIHCDLNNDSYTDVLLIDAHRYTAMLGTQEGTLEEVGTTIAQTDYLASVSVDFDGDGEEELLTVGSIGIWTIDMNHPEDDPVQYAAFTDEISSAVFGDFDGDGVLEIAVLEEETQRAAVYDYAGGEYRRIQLISSPIDVEKGVVITAEGIRLITGNYTTLEYDQLLIQYCWPNGNGDRIVIYDAVQMESVLQFDMEDNQTISAMTCGNLYTLAGHDDIAAVFTENLYYYAAVWKYSSGKYVRQADVVLGAVSDYQITDLTAGDLNGDGYGDLLFLNAGFGEGGGLGWLMKDSSSSFTASGLEWGTETSLEGNFSQLLLTDITGDGMPDALTTLTYLDSSGTYRTYLYMAEGSSSLKKTFGAFKLQQLAGDYAAGIDFKGGEMNSPALSSFLNTETNLGDVLLVKGRSAVIIRSQEGGTGEEEFLYLVHSAVSEKPESVITDIGSLGSDYYTWVDEWSSFYIEVWGSANGDDLTQFKTTLLFDADCFTVESAEAGNGFTVSMNTGTGTVFLQGTATEVQGPEEGEYILLARVLFRPTVTGGVAIPEDGSFKTYSAGFGIEEGSESINGAFSCSVSIRDALENLELFSVRLDYNDDGAVNIKDFSAFAADYGHGSQAYPYKNPKAATFDTVSSGNGLNIQDFTVFAAGYGITSVSVSERFYDELGIDPHSWIPSEGDLPSDIVDEIFEEENDESFEPAVQTEEKPAAVFSMEERTSETVYFSPLIEEEEKDWFLSF